jgi:phenylalanyl-tRNA synthetase alpha chain
MLPDSGPPTLAQYLHAASDLTARGVAAFSAAADADALEEARIQLLGDKRGELLTLQKALGSLPAEHRRDAGRAFNEAKTALTNALEERRAALQRGRTARLQLDLTMPGRQRWAGGKHPVTVVIDEIVGIFRELGFTVALGPESESEWYNFGALNFPPDHPAMDLHDTLYLGDGTLLRTHTSPVQIRTLQRHAPPIRILAPGTVFRRDPFDASHAPAFAQIEGLAVDEGISFVDLKATLTHFARRFFGATRTRFRPSYFPFTEPSAEFDLQRPDGTWLELGGCGMVHPNVLRNVGIDPEEFSGFAFGFGIERMPMIKYGVQPIKTFFDSDVRWLKHYGFDSFNIPSLLTGL